MPERKLNILITAKDQASRTLSGISGKLGGIAAVAGGAMAGGLATVAKGSLDFAGQTSKAMDAFSQQTGIAGDELGNFKSVALDVFASNWGESVESVAQSMARVHQVTQAEGDALENITTKALVLEERFGKDVAESVDAVSTLMDQFGLTADEAFDFVVGGIQRGLDKSDDFLDSITEYSNQFAGGGASASEFFSLMESGMQGGVLGTDKAADAFKEFSVRVADGSDDVFSALKDMFGENGTGKILKSLGDGTLTTIQAFEMVTGKLGEMTDKVDQDRAGVALLGSQWEDMTAAGVLGIDLMKSNLEDMSGVTDAAASDATDLGAQWEAAMRQLKVGLEPAAQTLMPLLADGLKTVGEFLKQAQPIFAQFAIDLKETIGPAILLINDALTRMGEVFGLSSGEVSGMDVALKILEKGLGVVTSGIQAAALLMQGIAWGTEKVDEAIRIAEDLREMLKTIFDLAIPDWLKGGGSGLGSRFDLIAAGMEKVVEKGRSFKETLGNLPIPDWLVPGSPTPLELGLLGISSAFDQVITSGSGLGGIFAGLTGLGGGEPPLPDTTGLTGLIGQQSSETVEAQNEVEASLGRLDQAVAVYTENSSAAFEMNFQWIGELNKQLKIMAGLFELNTANAKGLRDAAATAGVTAAGAESAMGGPSRI